VPPADPAEVVGRRIGAALLDLVLMGILFVIVGLALGEGESSDGNASINLEGGSALLYFALVLLYYFATEAAWGQTAGKRLPGAGKVAVRTLLRIVDGFPFMYLLGLIVMLATPGKQRVGDLAAGTVVVRADQPAAAAPPPPPPPPP
jgi:uncharacterized RDD family membrane protein YckC